MSFPYLLKCAEDSIHVVRFNPDPRIGDGKFNTVELPDIPDSQLDPAPWSKLEGIADKILQNLLELGYIGDDGGKVLFDIPANLQTILPVQLFDLALSVSDDFLDVDGRQFHGHLFCVQTRQGQNIVDQLEEKH